MRLNRIWKGHAWAIIFWAKFGIAAILSMLWLVHKLVAKTFETAGSIPSHYWWWGLGIAVFMVVIWFLVRSKKARQYAGETAKKIKVRWLLWPVALALLIYFALRGPLDDKWNERVASNSYAGARLCHRTFSDAAISTRVLMVRREWSEWVDVPHGQDLHYERMEPVAFEIETRAGKTFQFPRDFPGHFRIPKATGVRFRVADDVADTVPMWLRFSHLAC